MLICADLHIASSLSKSSETRGQIQNHLRVLDHVEANDCGDAQSIEKLAQRAATAHQLYVPRENALSER
jgi:hypothetical protein